MPPLKQLCLVGPPFSRLYLQRSPRSPLLRSAPATRYKCRKYKQILLNGQESYPDYPAAAAPHHLRSSLLWIIGSLNLKDLKLTLNRR